MNNPITEGAVFRQEWIKWATRPKWKEFRGNYPVYRPRVEKQRKKRLQGGKPVGKSETQPAGAVARSSDKPPSPKWCDGVMMLFEWRQETGIAEKSSTWRPISCRRKF